GRAGLRPPSTAGEVELRRVVIWGTGKPIATRCSTCTISDSNSTTGSTGEMTPVSEHATPLNPSAADEITLDVRGLRMTYGTAEVLKGIDFTARRGEVVALLGPNGAGKSTTIEILEGFRMRSGGDVRVLGSDPAHGDERWRSRLGVVLQSWRDHGKWKVRELLVHLGSYYASYSTPQVRRPWNIDELLAVVGLTEHAAQRIARLSGGQRRRLDVAVGIV